MIKKIRSKTTYYFISLIAFCFLLNGCTDKIPEAAITVSTPLIVITPKADVPPSVSQNAELPISANSLTVSDDVSCSVNQSTSVSQPSTDRMVIYQEGFFYEPLSSDIKQRITGISYPSGCTIPYEDLRYLNVKYIGFDGNTSTGELICNKAIADSLLEIFYELYTANYPIGKIRLIDEYGGDDTLSMYDNNTSCFNYRVVEGTDHLSKHAQGLAIDINPYFNPYVTYPGGVRRVSPEPSEPYADRSSDFPGKISHEDLCFQLFQEHGFTWGGDWKTLKDYQHFQISK